MGPGAGFRNGAKISAEDVTGDGILVVAAPTEAESRQTSPVRQPREGEDDRAVGGEGEGVFGSLEMDGHEVEERKKMEEQMEKPEGGLESGKAKAA
jgi:hypothetical protein